MDEQIKEQTRQFEQAETAAEQIAMMLIAFRAKLAESDWDEMLIERTCALYLRFLMGR